jgi:hypothetical protein
LLIIEVPCLNRGRVFDDAESLQLCQSLHSLYVKRTIQLFELMHILRRQTNSKCLGYRLDPFNGVQAHYRTYVFVLQPGNREIGHAATFLHRHAFHSTHYLFSPSPMEPLLNFLILLPTFCLLRKWSCEKTSCDRTLGYQPYILNITEWVHFSLFLAIQQIV